MFNSERNMIQPKIIPEGMKERSAKASHRRRRSTPFASQVFQLGKTFKNEIKYYQIIQRIVVNLKLKNNKYLTRRFKHP
jgi:hypothetical protein